MAQLALSHADYRRLVGLLAERVGLTPLARQTLLEEAGLAAFRTRLHFDADARTFAAELVRRLQEHGTLAGTGQPALVSLLVVLAELVVGHEDDAAFVARLLAASQAAPPPVAPSPPDFPSSAAPAPSRSNVPGSNVPTFPSETVRELLRVAFSEGELTTLCFDHFREVYEEFSSGMSKSDRVQRLVAHCERRGETARLLALVKAANPYQYERFFGG